MPVPLGRWVDGYAVKKKTLVGYEYFQYAEDSPLAVGDVDLTRPNNVRIVLQHWPGLFSDPLNVSKICSTNTASNCRHIGWDRCANDC